MDNYDTILDILKVSDDISQNRLEIISSSLKNKKSKLNGAGLKFEETREGINIKLSEQDNCKIYKTKEDILIYHKLSFSKDILIIEDGIVWAFNDDNKKDSFIENIKLWFSYKEILIDKVADCVNTADNEFILLSTDKGKIDIGFHQKPIEYFLNEFKQETFESITKLIDENNDFISFFKDAFIEVACQENKDRRFSYAIKKIDIINENANRNYSLYKNKFSFEEFEKGLEQSKNKYFREYQSFLSDFLGKITNLPIQIGVYLFLIHRFSESIAALIATLVLIIISVFYNVKVITIMEDNIKEIKANFDDNIASIKEKSGIGESEFIDIKKKITGKFNKFISLLEYYKYINIASSSLFIVIISILLF